MPGGTSNEDTMAVWLNKFSSTYHINYLIGQKHKVFWIDIFNTNRIRRESITTNINQIGFIDSRISGLFYKLLVSLRTAFLRFASLHWFYFSNLHRNRFILFS